MPLLWNGLFSSICLPSFPGSFELLYLACYSNSANERLYLIQRSIPLILEHAIVIIIEDFYSQ